MSTTATQPPVSLRQAACLLAEERSEKPDYSLIRYLVREHDIPVTKVGICHVLDARGLRQLRKALGKYRAKPEVN